MAWCPFAVKKELPFNKDMPKRRASATLILHTNGGGTDHGSLYGWFSRPHNRIASHFQVMWDGTIEQYLDTDRQAYAQYAGNGFAVSVETQDDTKPSRPWTDSQVNAIVRLAAWLKVPARLSPDGPGGGVGYHSQYADWNKSGHDCPGKIRIHQIGTDVLPKLQSGADDVTPQDKKDITAALLTALGADKSGHFPVPDAFRKDPKYTGPDAAPLAYVLALIGNDAHAVKAKTGA